MALGRLIVTSITYSAGYERTKDGVFGGGEENCGAILGSLIDDSSIFLNF